MLVYILIFCIPIIFIDWIQKKTGVRQKWLAYLISLAMVWVALTAFGFFINSNANIFYKDCHVNITGTTLLVTIRGPSIEEFCFSRDGKEVVDRPGNGTVACTKWSGLYKYTVRDWDPSMHAGIEYCAMLEKNISILD